MHIMRWLLSATFASGAALAAARGAWALALGSSSVTISDQVDVAAFNGTSDRALSGFQQIGGTGHYYGDVVQGSQLFDTASLSVSSAAQGAVIAGGTGAGGTCATKICATISILTKFDG